MSDGFTEVPERERIIVALDCDRARALELAQMLSGKAAWVKVGMTLFYAEGPSIVEQMRSLGFKVFLDLKFHDIPHQVRGAAAAAAAAGADMLTMHAVGGADMMKAAVEGAHAGAASIGAANPITLAITVLTSMDEAALRQTGVQIDLEQQVVSLARLAGTSGVDGVVASPREAAALRSVLGPDAAIVTPGVRPAWAAVGDQSRVATPRSAFDAGASHLVIGRPITEAENPGEAFSRIVDELR